MIQLAISEQKLPGEILSVKVPVNRKNIIPQRKKLIHTNENEMKELFV